MERVLITGGNGMIGRAIVEQLSGKYEIIIVDAKTNLSGWGTKNIQQIQNDIRDSRAMEKILETVDHLIHLAAAVHFTPKNADEERMLIEINLKATNALFLAAAKKRIKRAIFFSTSDVYANSDVPLDESCECEPKGIYGRTKFEAEVAIRRIATDSDMSVGIFRPASAFGSGDRGSMKKLISMARKGIIPVVGEGENLKALSYSKDLALASELFLQSNHFSRAEIFNLATGNYTFHDMLHAIRTAYNMRFIEVRIPPRLASSRLLPASIHGNLESAGSSKPLCIDKVQSALGYKPQFALEQALADCRSYYLETV